MKKSRLIIVLLLAMVLIVGCEKQEEKVISNGKKVDTSKMLHKHCTRGGSVTDGEASLNYEIYYTGEKLNIIESEEKVTSDSSSVLDTYEEAYNKIHKYYEGLEYYDTRVERNDNSVISYITINYDKIDIDKLISIEGEEDNIFENKVPKVDKWLELAKKVGTKCKLVEE